MEILFTLLSHRYERRSILLTSNLVFSDWEKIFKDPLTTAAAIDRVVHHSVILELNVSSYRMEAAKKRTQKEAKWLALAPGNEKMAREGPSPGHTDKRIKGSGRTAQPGAPSMG